MPLGKLADGLIPTIGIGIAIARLGCFLQGCCFGTVCTLPWCVSFPSSAYVYSFHVQEGLAAQGASHSAPVHALQLYFSAGGLLLTAVALWLLPRKRYDGQVALVALVVYGISAAALEFFRADAFPRAYWGPLPQLEWTALGITAVASVALFLAERSHRRNSISPTLPREKTA
jgi:phosphatidylglycerol:prolipoprotein diacylglycerol transferase